MTDPRVPADRRLTSEASLEALRFDEAGLVPVVAQDAGTGAVLMVAWANREALATAMATGEMHYWSRSRKQLWRKGESSGNTQALVSLHADCDGDTVLARVHQKGPACHTGDPTCFGEGAAPEGSTASPTRSTLDGGILSALWEVIETRDRERPEGSYTTRLLRDENLRMKKLGEEHAELLSALARGSESAPEEAADLLYHLLVALKGAGRSWREVEAALKERRG
jgi:phosphoribosyl-AMP cyclohydrolase / phosphoribosyl-ATP pyrophosphohydrolase